MRRRKKMTPVEAATSTKSLGDYVSNRLHYNTGNRQVLEPDFDEASNFLALLDPEADEFTFQTFDDNKERNDPRLSRVIHGSLEGVWEELSDLNQQGAAIAVMVNKANGKGRKLANVVGVRAVWQEADNGDEPELPCEPHITVETSPEHHHRYILTDGPTSDFANDFNSVQMRLVKNYGSDPSAKDISRVMRLPGTLHKKVDLKKGLDGTPHIVRIISTSGDMPFSWDKVKQLFPPVDRAVSKATRLTRMHSKDNDLPFGMRDRILGALENLDPDLPYDDWLIIGMALHSAMPNDIGLSMWREWSEGGSKFKEDECENKWNTFHREEGASHE